MVHPRTKSKCISLYASLDLLRPNRRPRACRPSHRKGSKQEPPHFVWLSKMHSAGGPTGHSSPLQCPWASGASTLLVKIPRLHQHQSAETRRMPRPIARAHTTQSVDDVFCVCCRYLHNLEPRCSYPHKLYLCCRSCLNLCFWLQFWLATSYWRKPVFFQAQGKRKH